MSDVRQRLVEFLPHVPFLSLLGIEVDRASAEEVVLRLPHRPELDVAPGKLHGGAMATVMDAAAASAAVCSSPGAAEVSTVSLTVNYLAPADGVDVLATARVERVGRLTSVRITASDTSGTPLASGVAVIAVRR